MFRLIITLIFVCPLFAADWYVSAARGKGRVGSKEKPAKDLGNIINQLAAGDTVHIAEGTYLGRGKSGSDVIKVPVQIIGGYSDDFSTRDPWGAHKTIFSGENTSKNWVSDPRIFIDLNLYRKSEVGPITIDGIIIDHADRNRYLTEERLEIGRKADPKTGKNPTPDRGGLVIIASKTNSPEPWKITVQNCIVMNTAPTQGAMTVSGHKGSKITIKNNLIINNTGIGMFLGSKYVPSSMDDVPEFTVENNTILFTWKYDPIAQSFSGNALECDASTKPHLKHNVLGFSDRHAINNARKSPILLEENLIVGSVDSDYLEFDTRIALDDIEDEAMELNPETMDNVNTPITVPVSKAWAKLYGSRVLIDRNAMEADIKVQQTRANEIRSMLGLNLQAGTIDGPDSPVWLPAMSLEDALAAAIRYHGKFGCSKP